jgi:hypothetical protein
MVSETEKVKYMMWFFKSRFAVTVQRRFHMVFGREPTKKSRCTYGINCLIRQAAFIKEKALRDDQSLKLRWIQSLQSIRISVSTVKHATKGVAQNSMQTSEI